MTTPDPTRINSVTVHTGPDEVDGLMHWVCQQAGHTLATGGTDTKFDDQGEVTFVFHDREHAHRVLDALLDWNGQHAECPAPALYDLDAVVAELGINEDEGEDQ